MLALQALTASCFRRVAQAHRSGVRHVAPSSTASCEASVTKSPIFSFLFEEDQRDHAALLGVSVPSVQLCLV